MKTNLRFENLVNYDMCQAFNSVPTCLGSFENLVNYDMYQAKKPQYRKQGLVHRLLNHVTDEMKRLQVSRFWGETRTSNISMQTVFEDCGDKLNKVEENYFENPN